MIPQDCLTLLDKADKHACALLLAHGDPVLSVHLVSGGDALVDAWRTQAEQQAQQGDYAACRTSLIGWCAVIKQRIAAETPAAAREGARP